MRTLVLGLLMVAAVALSAPEAAARVRVGDLTLRSGDVPRRLAGYGLVTGLDGTGDRTMNGGTRGAPAVGSVISLLRRFGVEVPTEQLRTRDVAAVLVTAEVSPYLRSGGRFEVHVSALGDATSLRGGVLWITPLVSDPGQPPVATAQGPIETATEDARVARLRRANTGRIAAGGLLEVDPPATAAPAARLFLRRPDLATAARIAAAINAALGDSSARVEDPGSVALKLPAGSNETSMGVFATVDTIRIDEDGPRRVVLDARAGTVVVGGDVAVGPAVVTHRGITLRVGTAPRGGSPTAGLVQVSGAASVQDVVAGLHAAGAVAEDMAAILEALQAAGALVAEVVVR